MRPASQLTVFAGLREAIRRRPILGTFVVGYLVGFTVLGAAIGAELTVPYLVVVAILMIIVVRLDLHFDLGNGVLWALAAWGLVHMAGGIVPLDDERTLYSAEVGIEFIRYDRLVHAFGFGAATLACGKVLRHWLPGQRIDWTPAGLVILAGMGVGAINEMVEFLATLVFEETNVGGFDNTGWDLVFDLIGAFSAGAWLHWRSRSPIKSEATATSS